MRQRPRRNRSKAAWRDLVQENFLRKEDLIYPLFISETAQKPEPISSMPGVFRHTLSSLLEEVEDAQKTGLKAVILFPAVAENNKDKTASHSIRVDGLYLRALSEIKKNFPEILLITDVAMDPYSIDGHDGYVENGQILNDITLSILADMSLSQAQAGADILGPSDMMDGRVGYIRDTLEKNGYSNVGIMSYSAKYASSFYGPFREALQSAPKSGDKKTYQMNPANSREAVWEAHLDDEEGADILMVKPGLPYLDIIYRLKETTLKPIAAYHVSGEYAMLKAAAQNGWIDGEKVMMESLLCFKRAGADMILTYCAKEAATLL